VTQPPLRAPRREGSERITWAASAAGSAATAGLLLAGRDGWLAFVAWSVSLGLALVAVRPLRTGPRLERADWPALGTTVALAAVFRLWHVLTIPNGLWIDELATAVNAARLAHAPFAPFGSTPLFADGPHWVHTANLYLYACLTVLKPTGFSQFGVKLLSVLPGIAAPPLLYLLARRFLPRPAALAAAGLLAVSSWHVAASRRGWDEVLLTTLAIAVFAKLHDYDVQRSGRAAYTAGVLLGIAQFTYLASRLTALAACAFVGLRFLAGDRRQRFRGASLFAVGILQAVLPLAVVSVRHPLLLDVRASELSVLPSLRSGHLQPLFDNIKAYALMFNAHGDPNARHDLPGKPMFNPVVGALFLAGLFLAVLHPRRRESLLCLCWLGFGLLGGVLSVSEGTPNSYRVGQVEPACLLLCALALGFAMARLDKLPSRRLRIRWWLAVAPVVVSAMLTSVDYFVVRPSSRQCWDGLEDGAYTEILRRAAERLRAGRGALVLDPLLRSPSARLMFDGLLPAQPGRPVARWVSVDTLHGRDLRDAVALVPVSGWERLDPALRELPATGLVDPFGRTFAVAVSTNRALLGLVAGSSTGP
jgi:hypothetical protein